MRIDFIRDITDSCENVIKTTVVSSGSIDVKYRLFNQNIVTYRVYQPTPQEYLLGKEVIDRAHEAGVDVIVATTYSQVSRFAKSYAESKGINILSTSKQYKYLIVNGKKIGFE